MPVELVGKKHVFLDWSLIEPGYGVAWGGVPTSWEMPYGLQIASHPPAIDPSPLLVAEHPWESFVNVYCTLFEDEGRMRLYYEPHVTKEDGATDDLKAMLAYAESSDGITWTKPRVGKLSFRGSTDNNLVFGLEPALGRGAHGATVFKDASAPPDARYKLIHMGREEGRYRVFGAVSPDGLSWTALREPLLDGYISDTQTVVRFDERKGRYVGYFRGWTHQAHAPGVHGRRAISYAETDDFGRWPTPEIIVAPEAYDPPDVDIYTNSYVPWPGTADAHLMFPAYYLRAKDILEVHLLTSRDGVRWERPWRTPLIGAGEPGSGREGGVYAGCGLVETRAGRLMLPIGPKIQTHNQSHFAEGRATQDRGMLRQAVWRPDGLTSLEAETEGGCTTFVLVFEGNRLRVNIWTRFGGEARFELADPSGEPIAGHSFAECDPLSGDLPARDVTWGGNADLSPWSGKPVRLRIRLKRARLHALQFV
ncbi:MAG: hypothetical protein RLZZ387_4822 [Chloroflexota bacterium]|jgi:hypothetical protein